MSQNPGPQNPKQWPWPDSLDALAAAPAHHQLLLQDQRVRVLQTRIAAKDVVPLHTHRWGGVAYVPVFKTGGRPGTNSVMAVALHPL
jgi:hypothetical protein